jgi:hypothetical protein
LNFSKGPIRFQRDGSNRFDFLHAFGTTDFSRQVLGWVACTINSFAIVTNP